MDAIEAIRKRRSVRRFTDAPVSDADVDELVRLGLLAPTGGMSQSWSILVVRDAAKRAALADLVIRGGGKYFAMMRPPKEGATPERARPVGPRLRPAGARHLPQGPGVAGGPAGAARTCSRTTSAAASATPTWSRWAS